MSLRSLRFVVLAAPFLLAACGEGYDLIRTDGMFPYGNNRTAGSGVAYVLAKMMPERELNLKPAESSSSSPKVEPAIEPAASSEDLTVQEKAMEKLFDEALKK